MGKLLDLIEQNAIKNSYSKTMSSITNSQQWQCTETGHISNSGALSRYQKARAIDTSKRVRVL